MASLGLGLTSGPFCLVSVYVFCGERKRVITEEGLDLNYWKHCLMLTRCEHYCRQVRHRGIVFQREASIGKIIECKSLCLVGI